MAPQRTQAQEVSPPILVAPYNNTDVTDKFVVWSWFMQPKASTGEEVVCNLKVVEILKDQTAEEALRNNPLVLEKTDLRSSSWQANLGSRSFIAGHRYAWRISARVGPKVISESEIWTFVYAEPLAADTAYVPPPGKIEPSPPQNQPEANPGQQPPSGQAGIKFSSNLRSTAETSNLPGELSQAPADFFRVQVDPTVNINGAPLELSFLVTTEKNSSQSTLNRGTFGYERKLGGLQFDLRQRVGEKVGALRQTKLDVMRDSLRAFQSDTVEFNRQIEELKALENADPVEGLKKLDKLGVSPGTDRFFLDIPTFGFGAVAPRFTDLSMNAVTLSGGFIEYNPGNLYVAAALGKSDRQIDLSGISLPSLGGVDQSDHPTFFKNIYGARVGYGRKEGSNLILSALYSLDDGDSRILEHFLDSSGSHFAPQENFLLGLAGQELLDEIGLSLNADLNLSLFTEPLAGGVPRESRLKALATRVFGGNNTREASIGDIAYSMKANKLLSGNHATASVSVRMVGPSYRSVGTVGLRTDIFGYDARYGHELLGNQLGLTGSYGYEMAGFVLADPNKSTLRKFALAADVRPHSLPSLQIGFSENRQDQESRDNFSNRSALVRLINLGLRYTARLGSIRNASSISLTLQKGTSDDGISQFTSSTVALNDRISFRSPVSLLASISHTTTETGADTAALPGAFAGDFSVLYQVFGNWQNTAGISYSTNQQVRTRGVFLSSGLDITGTGSVELRWEYTDFNGDPLRTKGSIDRILRLLTRLRLG